MIDNKNQIKTTEEQQRLNELGQVSSIINKMQHEIKLQQNSINKDSNIDKQIQSSTIKMLGSVTKTINQVGHGMKNVATGTLETGKDAISQYSKSITKDINVDKQNIVAMALSKTSPLFGYFASKFMETDIFKNVATKIKNNLGNAIGSVALNFKNKFKGFFNRKTKTAAEKVLSSNKKIPKLQHGGYIEKGGIAKLHSAEVVMPIEKILNRIDESNEISRNLVNTFQKSQLNSSNILNYNKKTQTFQKVGMIKGFSKALKQSHNKYSVPANERMLRALIAIQDAMGATVGKWSQVWKKMFAEHPTFRNMVLSLKAIKNTMGIPFKMVYAIFKTKGGYKGHLSKSNNPMKAMAENTGLIYTGGMWRLDNIAKFTKATSEATRDLSTSLTGIKYPYLEGVSRGGFSAFSIMRGLTNFLTKYTLKGVGNLINKPKLGQRAADFMTKKRRIIPRFGRTKELYNIYGKLSSPEKMGEQSKLSPTEFFQKQILISNNKLIEAINKLSITSKSQHKITQKKKQKLLTYTKQIKSIDESNLKVQKKMNKRARLQRLLSKFSFKKLAGIASLFTTFVVPFLFGGGLKKMLKNVIFKASTSLAFNIIKKIIPKRLISGIKKNISKRLISGIKKNISKRLISGIKKIIPKGLISGIKKIGPSISTLIKKLLPILSKLAGPVMMMASAGIIGWKIGKGIDKFIGVSDKFEKTLNRYDKKANKAARKLSRQQVSTFKKATDTKQKYSKDILNARRQVKMQTLIGAASQKRQKDLGYFGRSNLLAINTGQQQYINDNIKDYLKYSYNDIKAYREMWLKAGGYSSKLMGIDAGKYGYRRERNFYNYLKRKAPKLSKKELKLLYKQDIQKWTGKKSFIDSIPDYIENVQDYTKNIAMQKTASGIKIAKELVKQGKQAIERNKEMTKNVIESVSHISNTITSSNIQNTTNNGSNQEASVKFSETTKAIMQGA